nr:probable phospholipid-transporting ATPase 4 isoform X4 [Ipomoea trifida]
MNSLQLVTYSKSKEKLIGSCTMFFHQGNYHSQVRKLVQSSLSPEVLRKLVPEIEVIAITSLESWANKQIINTFQEMKKELCITRPQCHPQLAGRNAREETATPGEFVCHRLSSSISRGRRSSAMSSCHATIPTPPLPELQFAGEEAIVAVELSPPGRGKSMAVKKSISMQITSGSEMVKLEKDPHAAFALIIDGKTLCYALEDDMKQKILNLAVDCASVISCRVSQKQKALEADIGVGISRAEGMQDKEIDWKTMKTEIVICSLLCLLDLTLFILGELTTKTEQSGKVRRVWRASKSLGTSSQIFAGAFPENYEPPSGFYFEVNDDSPVVQIMMVSFFCQLEDDTNLFDYNVLERVNDFVAAALSQGLELLLDIVFVFADMHLRIFADLNLSSICRTSWNTAQTPSIVT